MPLELNGLCEFGPFRFDRADQTLWRDGQIVPLTPKALLTLGALLEQPGKLVEKDGLIQTVWPDTFVEEGNLAVQISLLRKTLGDEAYIETIPRRGYRFSGAVRELEPLARSLVRPESKVSRRGLLAAVGGSAVAAAALWMTNRKPSRQIQVKSLAVLPFQWLQAKPEDQGLGLGMADTLITRLGSAGNFTIRPTLSVREFDRPARDPLEAGRKLKVEAVLDATIQEAGDRIRLNAQLIRVEDGQHLWTDTFDFRRDDLFALEDQLAGRLVASLAGTPPPAQNHRPNQDAHRLYTLALYHRNRWTAGEVRKAVELSDQAIALDPNWADAHALRGLCWGVLGALFGARPQEAFPKAEESARVALSLDDKLWAPHHGLGDVQFFYHLSLTGAEAPYRRALELNPNNPDTLTVTGLLRTVQHRQAEGIAAMKHAVEVDPTSAWARYNLAFIHACAGQLDAAFEETQRALEFDPLLGAAYNHIYNLNMALGKHKEAVDGHLRAFERPGADRVYATRMREVFAAKGIRGFLEARIERLLKGSSNPVVLGQQYAFLGQPDRAMDWLEKSLDERQGQLLYINQHPMYNRLRGNARFDGMVRKLGL